MKLTIVSDLDRDQVWDRHFTVISQYDSMYGAGPPDQHPPRQVRKPGRKPGPPGRRRLTLRRSVRIGAGCQGS